MLGRRRRDGLAEQRPVDFDHGGLRLARRLPLCRFVRDNSLMEEQPSSAESRRGPGRSEKRKRLARTRTISLWGTIVLCGGGLLIGVFMALMIGIVMVAVGLAFLVRYLDAAADYRRLESEETP